MSEKAAAPKFERGQTVRYVDHQDRLQHGKVQSIDAHWPSYSNAGSEPHFVYSVEHPTYRNRRHYISEDRIMP